MRAFLFGLEQPQDSEKKQRKRCACDDEREKRENRVTNYTNKREVLLFSLLLFLLREKQLLCDFEIWMY